MAQEPEKQKDFFISYTSKDSTWAEWIAFELENANYSTIIQAWDIRPGSNFVAMMDDAAKGAARTIAVLSYAYLESDFAFAEWAEAFRQDPKGKHRLVLPIRIEVCEVKGLLGAIVYIDLVGLDEQKAREHLLAGVQQERIKPASVTFPMPTPQALGTLAALGRPPYPGSFDIHSRWVSTVAWSLDGTRLASGSGDGTVRVWDATTGENIVTYRGHSTPDLLFDLGLPSTVYALSWSPDGHSITSGGPGTSVHVWDATTGNTILTYRNHSDPSSIFALAWSLDGTRIASSCSGISKTVQISNATTGESVLAYKGHFDWLHVLTKMTLTLTVGALAWSPDSKRMASGGNDKRVHIWDATTGEKIVTYRGHSNQISSVAWSPDGVYIASAGYNEKTVRIWNAATGHTNSIYLGHASTVRTVAWSPNGMLIASGSNDKTVHLWEAATRRRIFTYQGHTEKITTVAWSPDGTHIASGSNDGKIQIWQAV